MCSINEQVVAAAPKSTLLVCTDVTGEQVGSDNLVKRLLTHEGVDAAALQEDTYKSPHSLAASSILQLDESAAYYDPVAAACLLPANDMCSSIRRVRVSVDPETGVLREDPCGREVEFLSSINHAEYRRILAEVLESRQPSPSRRRDPT